MKIEVAIESVAMKRSTELYVKFNICHVSDLRSSLNLIEVKDDGVNSFVELTCRPILRTSE
jgi:hypothetical protein